MLPRPAHRLFFALQPPPHAAAVLTARAFKLQRDQGLKGRTIAADHLHTTLHWLQDHETLPADLLQRAQQAAAAVEAEPFDATFTRIETFGPPSSRSPAIVLTGGGTELAALRGFWRLLANALHGAGLGAHVASGGYRPHVTLLYGDRRVESHDIEPAGWTVDEFVLLDSHAHGGRTDYVVLGRWPLRARQLSLID